MAKRVYFAFTYQDVIEFRANVVRNHNFAEGVEAAGYYDHSIWEDAQNTGPSVLKRLINSELENTSVTVVLIGSDTWARRWVRYEIFKSIQRGNRVLGIHINCIRGKDQKTKPLGPDPFNNLALQFNDSGTRVQPIEWKGEQWQYYADLDEYLLEQRPHPKRGQCLRLTHWYSVYDWVQNSGYENFDSWIG
jgi:Thoeris protein ThsB, TIR-like domain